MIFILLAFYTDLTRHKIPNVITMTALLSAWLYHIINSGFYGLWFSFMGLFVVMLPMVLLYSIRAVAAGDVKLFGAIGAWVGLKLSLYILVYSILFSVLIGMCILLFKKENWSRIKTIYLTLFHVFIYRDIKLLHLFATKKNLRFPFMIAVLPGVVAAYCHF
ncbi:prepilin peptidase [Chengkuizengella sp. SCS-71B]|uniref:A24 family peptidase n=1 Tax=Chengkuizengella sp. SCS-71B TaxID=3115290 RepID=UPI0032C241A5